MTWWTMKKQLVAKLGILGWPSHEAKGQPSPGQIPVQGCSSSGTTSAASCLGILAPRVLFRVTGHFSLCPWASHLRSVCAQSLCDCLMLADEAWDVDWVLAQECCTCHKAHFHLLSSWGGQLMHIHWLPHAGSKPAPGEFELVEEGKCGVGEEQTVVELAQVGGGTSV